MSTTLKIAIIGAGPAGCTLARILSQSPVPLDITVYEGESSANARNQGGTLDLHSGTGLAALKKAGLYEAFLTHARFDGESMQIIDGKTMRRYVNTAAGKEGDKFGRPEIDRSKLRQILVDSLPNNMIAWNHRLRRIDDDLTLHFDQTTVSGVDLLVGADGAWSKVRPLVSDEQPFYSGIAGVRTAITNVASTHPDLHKLVNLGSLFSFSSSKALMLQQLGDGTLTVGTWAVKPEDRIKTMPSDSPEKILAVAQQDYKDFDPRLTHALQVADAEPVAMNLYMLPIGHSWTHRPGVTLLGDAAHLMTPFAGEGVNLALADAMSLAEAIITAASPMSSSSIPTLNDNSKPHLLSQQISLFESQMFARSKRYQETTYNAMRLMFFVPGAPDSTIEEYIYNAAEDTLPDLYVPAVSSASSSLSVMGKSVLGSASLSVKAVMGWALWGGICTYFWLFRRLGWGKM